MNRGKKMLAGLTALVLLLLMCAAAAADGRPGVYDIAFYARKGGKQLYVWQTDQNGKLTKELRSCYRTGLVFMGWYTHPYGGYRVTQDTVFTQDTNVWAHWGRPAFTRSPLRKTIIPVPSRPRCRPARTERSGTCRNRPSRRKET